MFNRFVSSFLFIAAVNTGIVQAQIVPDGTLPTVVEQLENMRKITGGERVGNNLFHSFEEFSIPEGIEAIFENGLDIENIFTRITGSDISVIDGLLKTAGGANFFLINPNGIVFGENAVLDVGGSFIATTANRIEFADGTNFNARGDEAKVTLTISVPIGLRLDGDNGSITVNGSGNQIINDSTFAPIEFSERPTGLSVNEGQTLALAGNGIDLNGGVITTNGGNIHLTSIESGSIKITPSENGLALMDDAVTNYQDINLDRQSLIDGTGSEVGSIFVSGENINLSGGSFVFARNEGSLPGGSIELKANQLITFSGTSPDGNMASAIRSETLLSGEGTNLEISTASLVLKDESNIRTNSFSDATAGNINIDVLDLTQIVNSNVSASTFSGGNAGKIQLSTSVLEVINGGNLTSSTVGTGDGGSITINADSVEVSGTFFNERENINNRSNISSSSFSSNEDNPGNAGSLTINTAQLQVGDGGSISSSSFGTGNAGNLNISASESIEVKGKNGNFQSTLRSAVQSTSSQARAALGLPEVPSGDSGNVTISSPLLNVTKEGVVSVANIGTGEGGTLTINGNNLNLDEAASITAAASSGIGGDIILNTDSLNISNDSQITATVGGDSDGGNITINTTNLTAKKNNQITASADEGDGGNININASSSVSLNEQDEISAASTSGDGGNININTDILTALEQSKITANAVTGDGGNITINSRGYFVSEDSVVSASSEFGLDGTININSLENNFQQYLENPEAEIAIIPDFFIPRCANPDRAYLTLFPGDVLPESPDNYYVYPSQTDTDVVLQEPEYQEKLDRIVQRYLERLESEPEIEPEPERRVQAEGAVGEPSSPTQDPRPEETSGVSTSPESGRKSHGAEYDSAPVSSLIWQPGDPMINATEIVETEDGEVFLVPPAEKQEFLEKLRCGQSVK